MKGNYCLQYKHEIFNDNWLTKLINNYTLIFRGFCHYLGILTLLLKKLTQVRFFNTQYHFFHADPF